MAHPRYVNRFLLVFQPQHHAPDEVLLIPECAVGERVQARMPTLLLTPQLARTLALQLLAMLTEHYGDFEEVRTEHRAWGEVGTYALEIQARRARGERPCDIARSLGLKRQSLDYWLKTHSLQVKQRAAQEPA